MRGDNGWTRVAVVVEKHEWVQGVDGQTLMRNQRWEMEKRVKKEEVPA